MPTYKKAHKIFENIKRLRQILYVASKYGFGDIIERLSLQQYIPLHKRIIIKIALGNKSKKIDEPVEKRLRLAFEELGTTFIKLGQILSSRPDIVTPEFAKEFFKLHDEITPIDYNTIRAVVTQELGKDIENIFKKFNEVPHAVASIAQVHKAVLKNGKEVVVKIRKPGIGRIIESDISILSFLAPLIEKFIPESKMFNPVGIVDEFSKAIRKELDFNIEAYNCITFREHFRNSSDVRIPKIYQEYTTRKILVIELLNGKRINDVDLQKLSPAFKKLTAEKIANAYFKQILEDGFFHADPHPANILIMDDGKVAFLDFGIVGKIDKTAITSIINTFEGLMTKDFRKLANQYVNLGFFDSNIGNFNEFREEFTKQLSDFLSPYYNKSLKEIDLSAYLSKVSEIFGKFKVKIPPDLFLINKTLILLEALIKELDPDFKLIDAGLKYSKNTAKTQLLETFRLKRFKEIYYDFWELVNIFPKQLKNILDKLARDLIRIEVRTPDIETLSTSLNKTSSRISFSMIIAALIVGSSYLMNSTAANNGSIIQTLGIIGYIIAVILGLWLVISIIISGKY
jgi:ubiquinone biosynthesis protein